MQLSSRLLSLRQRHGLSQEELAARVHVARQTIGKWEAGQAQPELGSLLALCDVYHISLDALVREAPCADVASIAADDQDLLDFLLLAKRSTYAAHASESAPSRPGSHDFLFENGDWLYRDSYFGGSQFIGEEVVWYHGAPVWGMNYAGCVVDEPFSGDFLKAALMQCSREFPYRGPRLFQQGSWTYHLHADGNLASFSGTEEILYDGRLVFDLRFHGNALR